MSGVPDLDLDDDEDADEDPVMPPPVVVSRRSRWDERPAQAESQRQVNQRRRLTVEDLAYGTPVPQSQTPVPRRLPDIALDDVQVETEALLRRVCGIRAFLQTVPCPEPTGSDIEAKPIVVVCQVCHLNQVSTVIFPCMHCCMCDECASEFSKVSNVCPMCRTGVSQIGKVYFSFKAVSDMPVEMQQKN